MRLVITGDDFGATHRVNEAVEAFHRAGVLTHAGLMPSGPCLDEALRILRRNPGLGVGLHLALLDPDRFGLTTPAGPLPAVAPWRMGFALLQPRQRRLAQDQIKAQFEHFKTLDLSALAWDGHTHLHLHPAVFPFATRLAVGHGFRYVRLLRGEKVASLSHAILNGLSHHWERRDFPMQSADRVLGIRTSGRLTGSGFGALLRETGPGLNELYFHPGVDPLLPEEAAAVLQAAGIEPTAFK